ncbi:hypothetical protein CROQUDRAFT_88544 [Cronartium quercuum f. sp. fusiforme G11]|uniref:Uncharacterized protein n=1 Tax=Cronartium quercuum f. sp. fusiforme G11 TaxID=708437 RepID=A0A9P6TEW3_9BASI|nr:hypothetical protein CROQUDRAFT_88544 [Cronartium quercuum f. sp. fusiforme G11]
MGRSLVTAAIFAATLLALNIIHIQQFVEFRFGQLFISSAGYNLLELDVPTALRRHKLAPSSQV